MSQFNYIQHPLAEVNEKNFSLVERKKTKKLSRNKERKTNFKFLGAQTKTRRFDLCIMQSWNCIFAKCFAAFFVLRFHANSSPFCVFVAGFIHFIIRPRNHWSIHSSMSCTRNEIKRVKSRKVQQQQQRKDCSIRKRSERNKCRKKSNNYYVYAMYASLFSFLLLILRRRTSWCFSTHCFCGCY